ncbi:hypothetical protein [Tuwongella immobilis]|uniref:Uncharacterized protein n=1 Tax=Tuwongella immobilis TaxID=692036 RepID=A0A6C2YQH2_9BACT|nr:hypothetical protein [Tuwongella immobilis]VIP03726.1 Uncharacterized protein OS=[Clostridium] straminisolvens JCM 21531 GN=JCM21531_4598 PE=4 SV=1 [Tuwongella immobilis]VTS04820.1 Uncharacterized protein OS=[Clostridium] straminisolvens JCM 21531 GN=JCM21531_4598 PE=4 SV=1 [Tuwongella immobilis]
MLDTGIDKLRLWEGAVLGGIASAIMSAKDETFGRFRLWQDNAYICDGLDGREGTVFFESGWKATPGWVASAFFNPKCESSPFRSSVYNLNAILDGMPTHQRDVVNDAIRDYMSDEDEGKMVPLVTSAFWSTKEGRLVANTSWEQLFCDGASLVTTEVKGFTDEAVAEWGSNYQMPSPLLDLAIKLYQKRVTDGQAKIELLTAETRLLLEHAEDKSLGSCQQYLSQMEIYISHPLPL